MMKVQCSTNACLRRRRWMLVGSAVVAILLVGVALPFLRNGGKLSSYGGRWISSSAVHGWSTAVRSQHQHQHQSFTSESVTVTDESDSKDKNDDASTDVYSTDTSTSTSISSTPTNITTQSIDDKNQRTAEQVRRQQKQVNRRLSHGKTFHDFARMRGDYGVTVYGRNVTVLLHFRPNMQRNNGNQLSE